jgi:hypothetical protein
MKLRKYQQGGPMPAEAPMDPAMAGGAAPAPEQDPIMMMAEGAMIALQNQDCQTAMQVCEMLLQLVQGAQGEAAPAGEPVFRKGGKLARRVR